MMTQIESQKFFDGLKNLTQVDWFMRYADYGVLATWLNKYSVPFSLVITRWGLCFDFNMLESSQLLNINETSSDFHYKADYRNLAYIPSLDSNSIDRNDSFPWTPLNNMRHLITYFFDHNYVQNNPFEENQGFHIIFHGNFEFPFQDEKNHFRMGQKSFVTIDIIPIVYEADNSMTELNPVE